MMGRIVVATLCCWLLALPASARAGAVDASRAPAAASTISSSSTANTATSGSTAAAPTWGGYLGSAHGAVRAAVSRHGYHHRGGSIARSPQLGPPQPGGAADSTGGGTSHAALPTRVAFGPVAPNPSGGEVTFRFDLPVAATVRIAVYDIGGRLVGAVSEHREAGRHALRWNSGRARPAGVYVARLEVDSRPAGVLRLVVLR
jgi:hypothetical protein